MRSEVRSRNWENVKLTLLLDGVQRVDEAGRDKSFRSVWSLHPEPFRVVLEGENILESNISNWMF